MENNLIIKKANLEDIDKIIDIENDLNNRILSDVVLKNELNDNNYFYLIAYLDNLPIGYLSFSLCVEHADLNSIVIKKNYRQKNFAYQFLNFAIKELENLRIEKIFLEVRKSNVPAIKLYEKLSFTVINTRKNYYSSPDEDALIYIKEINSPHN
ncbi:MAG: ribosomal protein S18-alanine N-acetyltransferase [Clostridia bacterium]|nr:ribosomal protein S18-alanine N-acetyltransferase [Clostridia bacterium]